MIQDNVVQAISFSRDRQIIESIKREMVIRFVRYFHTVIQEPETTLDAEAEGMRVILVNVFGVDFEESVQIKDEAEATAKARYERDILRLSKV